ncbi:hypothetical protein BH11PSE13_BH11PSE13_12380 [soil metagenome]
MTCNRGHTHEIHKRHRHDELSHRRTRRASFRSRARAAARAARRLCGHVGSAGSKRGARRGDDNRDATDRSASGSSCGVVASATTQRFSRRHSAKASSSVMSVRAPALNGGRPRSLDNGSSTNQANKRGNHETNFAHRPNGSLGSTPGKRKRHCVYRWAVRSERQAPAGKRPHHASLPGRSKNEATNSSSGCGSSAYVGWSTTYPCRASDARPIASSLSGSGGEINTISSEPFERSSALMSQRPWLSDRLFSVPQFGPNVSPIVGPEILTADRSFRSAFNHNTQRRAWSSPGLTCRELRQVDSRHANALGESCHTAARQGGEINTKLHWYALCATIDRA